MPITFRPPEFRFSIPQGQHFHLEFPLFVDTATGELYDFTAGGGCTADLDLVKADGTVLTSFATAGADGVITLDAAGGVALDLTATFTDALEPTKEYAGASHGPVFGDLVITDLDGKPWLMAKGAGDITRKVTSS